MTSYYKTIKGIKYDKSMIEAADKSVSGKKDGRISINNAKKIIKTAEDGAGITEIESRTLEYIYNNYNFTPSADKFFADYLPGEIQKTDENVKIEKEAVHSEEETVTEIKGFFARYYLLIIIIALILFLVYLYSDRLIGFFGKGTEASDPVSVEMDDNENDRVAQLPEEVITAENEYIVKEKDTLYDISNKLYGEPGKWKKLYERNKDILDSPTMIFPGQKIRTDLEENEASN